MGRLGKTIGTYALIAVVTLVLAEVLAFAVLTWRAAADDGIGLRRAAGDLLRQHPLLDRRLRGLKRFSEYQFLPTTQHAFRPDSSFAGLRIGRHGFILNGEEDPADYPGKAPGTFRIVLLGGSSAAGATASGNDRTIAARLEALLNGNDAPRFQVLNFGMGGNYSYGVLARLITEVAYIDADAVILFDGFNDAHYANFEHLRVELPAPLMNWADYSYQYFDTMAGLQGGMRPPPPVMTYAYLLVAALVGQGDATSIGRQRAAIYEALPAQTLSAWVAGRDPRYFSVMKTNLDVAAAWAARRGSWLLAYLQPHPWEYKDLACERAAGKRLMVGRLGPTIDEAAYARIMREAFQGYARVYRELDVAYADAPRVGFSDLRRLFEDVADCIYNDPIHYNDAGNLRIAVRMHADLVAAGIAPATD